MGGETGRSDGLGWDSSPRREKHIPRRRSKSTNAILGRMDENRVYDTFAPPTSGILDMMGFASCLPGNENSATYARPDSGACDVSDVRSTQHRIDEELRKMKKIVCGERDAMELQLREALERIARMEATMQKKDSTSTQLRNDNSLLKAELVKLQQCLHESDMENARKEEQIASDVDRAEAMQARIASLEEKCDQLSMAGAESYSHPVHGADTDTEEYCQADNIAATVVDGCETGDVELEKLQKFTVELAEESDVALHAAVENAAVEIITLEKMLREEEGRRKSCQDTLESMSQKMAPIRSRTGRLIDLSMNLSLECNVLGELVYKGVDLERIERKTSSGNSATSKSKLATLLLQKRDVISQVMDAQESIMDSSKKLVDELQVLFQVLENHSCGMTDKELVAKVVQQLQLRHEGDEVSSRFRTVKDMEDFIDAIDILLCHTLDRNETMGTASDASQRAVSGNDKDAEIANLRMQVEASDLILQSALNAQAKKFEAAKEELRSHLIEVEQEAMMQAREYEKVVVDLNMKMKEMKYAYRTERPSADGPASPCSESAGPTEGTLSFLSRNSSKSSTINTDDGGDQEMIKLRCRLRREKELRKREQRCHSALSVERTRTMSEMLTTIRTLKWQIHSEGERARPEAAGPALMSKALRAVQSEIMDIKASLADVTIL